FSISSVSGFSSPKKISTFVSHPAKLLCPEPLKVALLIGHVPVCHSCTVLALKLSPPFFEPRRVMFRFVPLVAVLKRAKTFPASSLKASIPQQPHAPLGGSSTGFSGKKVFPSS